MDEKIRFIPAKVYCAVYGKNPGSAANERSKKIGPPFYKIGKGVFYRVDEVEAYFAAGRVETADSGREAAR